MAKVEKHQGKYAIGIGLNILEVRGIIINQSGKIVLSLVKKRADISADETVKIILDMFEQLKRHGKKYFKDVLGVGVSVSGIVDNKKKRVYWPERADHQYTYMSVPLEEFLEDKFNLPVIIDNDANASAWAEYQINFSKYKHLLFLYSGVGCGIIINGQLYRGAKGGAGELFVYNRKKSKTVLGDFSFLHQWPVDLNIKKMCQEKIALGKETKLIKKITPTGEINLTDILEAAEKKDPLAQEVVKEASSALGVKAAFLINIFNPEVVVLGGIEFVGDIFFDAFKKSLRNYSFSQMREGLIISPSKLGSYASPLGVALQLIAEKTLH